MIDVKDKILQGHVLDILKQVGDNTFDCIITSPPYYSQRYYGKEINTVWKNRWYGNIPCKHDWEWYVNSEGMIDDQDITKGKTEDIEFTVGHKSGFCKICEAWYGQLGQEPTPSLYIDHLTQIFNECRRVLKPTGLFFLNIGDTYAGSHSGFGLKIPNPKSVQSPLKGYLAASVMKPPAATCVGKEEWLKPKQLMLIPSRLAISLQEDGWILRADIIWKKKSHLPNSALDNFDCSAYEHIFMFSKEPYYFFDNSKARKQYSPASMLRQKYVMTMFGKNEDGVKCLPAEKSSNAVPVFIEANPKGALKSNIWEINTSNSKIKHFAAYSEELVKECLLPGCAKEVCVKCGSPKIEKYKMIIRDLEEINASEKTKYRAISHMSMDPDLKEKVLLKLLRKKISLGFLPTCTCNDNFDSGIVLDPFMGSGTTAAVAKKNNYHYCGIEFQPSYVELINKRLKEML